MSDSETRTTSLDRLRARARARVERTSLRAVARAVGMSPKALEGFLAGDPIRSASRRKLFAWLMDTDLEADERAARCVRTMKEVVSDLPEPAQLGAVLEMLEALRRRCSTEIGSVPLWLARVLEKVESYRMEKSHASPAVTAELVADTEDYGCEPLGSGDPE